GDLLLGRDGVGVALVELLERSTGQVVVDGVRKDEVAVRQPLHQRARAQTVGTVVGEVGLPGHEQAGDTALQVVVDPQATHGVVHRWVDAHRNLVRVLSGDALVHVEQVAVLGFDGVPSHALDGVGEVQVHTQTSGADAASFVADVLGGTGGDVTRHQVAEGRVSTFQVVVALVLGDLSWVAVVAALLGHPDTAVVAQRLAHQRQLGLVVTADRDAGRVDLRVAGVGEVRTLAVCAPVRGDVAPHGVGRQVENVAVPTGGQDHGIGEVRLDLTGDHVTGDDATCLAVHDDEFEHLVAGMHLDGACGDLAFQGLVGTDEQLLPRLTWGVEGPGDLHTTEGTVVEQTTVLTRERHTLSHALVDDLDAGLGQAVHVRFAGAEVTALDGVVEQSVDAVTVVAVVLGGVDAALRGDGVRTPGAVLVAERNDVVAGLAQGRRGGGTGQPGADDDDGELAPVGRVDQIGREAALVPALVDRPFGCLLVANRVALDVVVVLRHFPPVQRRQPDAEAGNPR